MPLLLKRLAMLLLTVALQPVALLVQPAAVLLQAVARRPVQLHGVQRAANGIAQRSSMS